MKILAVECSATPASVAILEDDKLIASAYTNVKLTHSQTLMPMIESTLSSSKTDINEIDGFAISSGPGSFTGIRIGISAIKGLAAVKKTPCVAVSTLFAMAQNYSDTDCIICAVMDARCNQLYNAVFDIENGVITRLCEDRALMCDELLEEIKNISQSSDKCVIIIGDGADIFYNAAKDIKNIKKAHPIRQYQNAVGVGFTSLDAFKKGETLSPNDLLPFYLRLPQAERELKAKQGE
jgi:tRNA threonylcarbamoyladenosine biosynthesis protein TsaB